MGDTSLVAAQRRIAAGLIDDSRAFRSGLRVRGYISLYTSPFTKRGLLCDTTVLACSIAAVVFFMIETYQKGDSPVALDWVCVSSCVCVGGCGCVWRRWWSFTCARVHVYPIAIGGCLLVVSRMSPFM
jgi:hypothetical protein